MGCGNEISDWDDRAVKDSMAGKNTELDPKLIEELRLEQGERLASNVDRIISRAIDTGKNVTDPEILKDLNRAIPTMSKMEAALIRDDQEISMVPETKEGVKNEIIAEHLEIISKMPKDGIVYREHTDFFRNSVKEDKEGAPAKVFLEVPAMTKESLIRMMNNRAPKGTDRQSMNLHHWRREDQGPRLVMERKTHQTHTKILHEYKPSKPVKNRTKFKKERNSAWKKYAKDYLGDWHDDIKEILIQDN